MHFPQQRVAPSSQPALDLISLAMLAPATARHNLRSILMANPNHFGTLTEASLRTVLNIRGDTAYERLERVGYDPLLKRLNATICTKRMNGFSSEYGANSSEEYVRFFISRDGGSAWQDIGLRAVNLLDVTGPNPRSYTLSLPLKPAQELRFRQGPVHLRAILSWNAPPPVDSPNWTPIWGNVVTQEMPVRDRHSASRPDSSFRVVGTR
jgi:hypothetical protein